MLKLPNEGLLQLLIFGDMVRDKPCAFDHNWGDDSIYVVKISFQKVGNIVFYVGHILFADDIFPEKQVIFGLKSVMFLTWNKPRETYLEDYLVLIWAHDVVKWGEMGDFREIFYA